MIHNEVIMMTLINSFSELEAAEKEKMARINPVYLDWCRIFNKEPNDNKFKTFASNYITMEAHAIYTGERMQFNEWYDCTEEEYKNIVAEREKAKEEEAAAAAAKAAQEEQERIDSRRRAERDAKIATEEARLRNIAGKPFV